MPRDCIRNYDLSTVTDRRKFRSFHRPKLPMVAFAHRRLIRKTHAPAAKPRGIRVRGSLKKIKLNNQADELSCLSSNGYTNEHKDTEPYCLIIDVTSDEEEKWEDNQHFIEESDSTLDALVSEPVENKAVPAKITL